MHGLQDVLEGLLSDRPIVIAKATLVSERSYRAPLMTAWSRGKYTVKCFPAAETAFVFYNLI